MIVKDMMAQFDLFQPTQLADALGILDSYGKDAWKMAGGYDSLVWFKERIKQPKAVVDLSAIQEMHGIKETPDGVEIGALTSLTTVENDPIIKAKYRLLSDALAKVASPQIRNAGSIGGNASQDARCLYYRYGFPCYRAGGNTCFADTPEGINREHALFDSDAAWGGPPRTARPGRWAWDPTFGLKSSGGERVIGTEEFFVGPKVDITHMTSAKPEEILTA